MGGGRGANIRDGLRFAPRSLGRALFLRVPDGNAVRHAGKRH